MKIVYSILLLGLLLIPRESFAWGMEGHHIVAEIASDRLSPKIRDLVKSYLGTMTFGEASTWMDDVRKDHTYDYMKTWHYIDVEKGQAYSPQPGDTNCVTQLQRVIKELRSRSTLSKEQIFTDLKVLFHLVGDIGQPLHASYPEDKGGNTIQVSFLGENRNLHHVWDTDIITYKKITTRTCEDAFSKMTKAEKKKNKNIDPLFWYNDSRNILPEVYVFSNNTIDEAYIEKNVPVIEKQLFVSGVRLANVLTYVFSN